jgi:chromosomal replication initiation ATPase DnaA
MNKQDRETFRNRIRQHLKDGLTPTEIVAIVPCDQTYAYRVIAQERLLSGEEPVANGKLKVLEERVRNLEKIVASLSSMKRFGGTGITAPQESSAVRLHRLLSDSERRLQKPE